MIKFSTLLILFQFLINPTSELKSQENMSLYNIKINAIDGTPIDLNNYKGKHILFVNVASSC